MSRDQREEAESACVDGSMSLDNGDRCVGKDKAITIPSNNILERDKNPVTHANSFVSGKYRLLSSFVWVVFLKLFPILIMLVLVQETNPFRKKTTVMYYLLLFVKEKHAVVHDRLTDCE